MSKWGLNWRQGPKRPMPTDRCETDGCENKATRLLQRPVEPYGSKRTCGSCAEELTAVFGWKALAHL